LPVLSGGQPVCESKGHPCGRREQVCKSVLQGCGEELPIGKSVLTGCRNEQPVCKNKLPVCRYEPPILKTELRGGGNNLAGGLAISASPNPVDAFALFNIPFPWTFQLT
jgi:hypothetical protein